MTIGRKDKEDDVTLPLNGQEKETTKEFTNIWAVTLPNLSIIQK